MFTLLKKWWLLVILLAACSMSGTDSGRNEGPTKRLDTTPPQITLLGNNPYFLKIGEKYIEPGAKAVDDHDGEVPVKISGKVNTKKIGEYLIVYTASDKSGNTALEKRRVIVKAEDSPNDPPDKVPPKITLYGDNPYYLTVGEKYKEPGAKAVDDRDGEVPVKISGKVNTNRAGEYKITYTASDKSGNVARAERRVIVKAKDHPPDKVPPKITLYGDNPYYLTVGEKYKEPGAKAVDDHDGEVPVKISGKVNTNRAGEYKITYTASDKSGNVARAERRVIVSDPESNSQYPPDSLTINGDLETAGYEGDTSVPRPDLGEWVNEGGKFATRITRVTDAAVTVGENGEKSPVHHYPKDQAWNSNQTLMVMGGRWLIQADTFERIKKVSSYKRWSHSDPQIRYGLEKCGDNRYCVAQENVDTDEITILYEIPGNYERMTLGEYEGNLDFQDRYIVLTGRKVENHDSEIATIILYDLKKKRAVIKDFDGSHKLYLTKTYKNDKLDWASITPTGKYVLIHKYTDMRSGVATDNKKTVEVYDLNLKYKYTLAYKANHGDICISSDGRRDYYVQVENYGPGAFDYYEGDDTAMESGVWQYDLITGKRVRLVANHGGGHISCRNHKRYGWAYISYKKTIGTDKKHPYLYRDIFAIKLGPEGIKNGERVVERFANSRYMKKDNKKCGYKYTDLGPHALPSPDGTMVLFKSNWAPGGCLDDFLVRAK